MADGQDWSAHSYRSADDRLTLGARVYPADRPDAPALLMMPGLTRNAGDFEPLVEHLRGSYRIVAADQRGRGMSEHDPDSANYRPDIYVADMFALLDSLGIERASLVGTSLGGMMAMVMAASAPARIPALVINDIGPELDEAGLDRIKSYVGGAPAFDSWDDAARAIASVNAIAFPDFTNEDWMAFARRTCVESDDGKVRFAYDPRISEPFRGDGAGVDSDLLWQVWDKIADKPVLLLRGRLSDLLAANTVGAMADRHSGIFEAVTVPRVGHAPILDEPAALGAILPFLARHAG